MSLNERKKRILQAIINDYINTADPVGSRAIAKKHELGLSSATIRNEMADLEDMGYLEQPHTSSGRIPSNSGYRFYVDQLMNSYKLTVKEINDMQYAMKLKMRELDKMINEYSKVISKFTNYTTVVMSPQMNKSTIKHLQLVPIDGYNVLIIIITNAGVVKNKTIKLDNAVSKTDLNNLTNVLNDKLYGLTLEEISLLKIKELHLEMKSFEQLLVLVLSAITDEIIEIDNEDVFLSGAVNIFNLPEYQDIKKAKEFLTFLEKKSEICRLLTGVGANKKGISISIGKENEVVEMQNCSVIVSKYSIGDRVIGKIGIIGPTRMEYAKVISSLEYLTDNLNYVLMKFFFDE